MTAKLRNKCIVTALLLAMPLFVGAATLDEVEARGTIRVATTLDYRPFSYVLDGTPTGIDIDLAAEMARAMGVQIEWITTSWPNLLDDLQAGRFDIAMSGVSITAERRLVGNFSEPYFETGKALLTRCAANEIQSLETADRPGVTVIVNPGGSNQRFVDAYIRQATVIVHPDNVTIFDALTAGVADVMITDAVEAQLESNARETLCMPALPGWLEPVTKAWLTPKDAAWTDTVNEVLRSLKRKGVLATIIERHVPAAEADEQ